MWGLNQACNICVVCLNLWTQIVLVAIGAHMSYCYWLTKCHTALDSTQLRIQHWIQHQICFVPIMLKIDSLLKLHSYLTKASCFSLLLMQQLFLCWSPVSQKNGRYGDHLSEFTYEKKCSVPPGRNVQCPLEDFRMLWLKFYSYLTKA